MLAPSSLVHEEGPPQGSGSGRLGPGWALSAPPTPLTRSEGRSPWVWPAGPDRPPCGLSAPLDPCWDSPPPYEKQEVGTPLGPF